MTRLLAFTGVLLGIATASFGQFGEGVDRVLREDSAEFEPGAFRNIPDGFLKDWALRLRITALTPAPPVKLDWRHGGEGLGGDVVRGVWSEELAVDEWTPVTPFGQFLKRVPRNFTVTFTASEILPPKSKRRSPIEFKDFAVEFEISYRGKVIRQFTERGPDGPTVSIMIFGEAAQPENVVLGLLERATRRADSLAKLPWSGGPFPRRYMVVTDLAGYGVGAGYGIRTTNRRVMEEESRALKFLGVNALRSAPDFLDKLIFANSGIGTQFAHRAISSEHGLGYPVPSVRHDKKTKKLQNAPDGAGCPFDPGVAEATQEKLTRAAALYNSPLDEVWAITVDEIGSVFQRAPDGKDHLVSCEYCVKGYQDFVRANGRTPAEFGLQEWSDITPVNLWKGEVPQAEALGAYYTMRFVNDASAQMFTPQRNFFAAKNAEKLKDSSLQQPFVYNYAMRGCTFLRRGGLDFFDFYRHADNAFVYETSNRDPRLWHWDSYLNDVGRVVCAQRDLKFGILIKPHRGAPIQRMLSAVTRSVRMIFWYTYGPEYKKGDSFSQSPEALAKTSWAAHLLGKTEAVLYNATLVEPVQIAILRTRQSPLETPAISIAVNEEAKWTFTALTHAHLPVDPLDETTVEQTDFSRYKIIYLVGTTLTKLAAEKLVAWVQQGGTLYVSGYSGIVDEAHRPLEPLREALGLKSRTAPELWQKVEVAGATALPALSALDTNPPPARTVGAVPLFIGREVLVPASGTETLAKFGDDQPAMTRHAFGQGQVYVTGFFGALEYAAPIMRKGDYDLTQDFAAARRDLVTGPARKLIQPTVDAGVPTVEGALLRDKATGKQAVVLMNWTYRQPGTTGRRYDHVPLENLTIRVRAAGEVQVAISAASDEKLPVTKTADGVTIALPKLAEGDVLLLE